MRAAGGKRWQSEGGRVRPAAGADKATEKCLQREAAASQSPSLREKTVRCHVTPIVTAPLTRALEFHSNC